MKLELLEDKYKVLLIIFERSFLKENMKVAYTSRKYIAYEVNVGYEKMRNLEKNLIDEGLIEKIKVQAEKGYLITDKGMKIINEIKGDK